MIIGTIEHEELGTLTIATGLTDKHIDQLIHYAQVDEDVKKNTSDEFRFKDREHYENWRKKGRTIFSMTEDTGNLLGLIWFGKELFPQVELIKPIVTEKYAVTVAVRIYKNARGKGLAQKFMNIVFSAYQQSEEYMGLVNKGIWLDVVVDNIPAIRAYTKFGFDRVSEVDKKNEIVMILLFQ